jgi:hypothetical protein
MRKRIIGIAAAAFAAMVCGNPARLHAHPLPSRGVCRLGQTMM